MPHGFTLKTSHTALAALVNEWLDISRFALPRPLTLEIEVSPLEPLPADATFNFHQANVQIRSAAPGEPIVLEWGPNLGRCSLPFWQHHGARVTIEERGLERPNELLRTFLMLVCTFLLRRVGYHHIHGATLLSPSDEGVLLVGVSGSGKSTTTALLAKRGWRVGTDDIAFLVAGEQPGTTDVVAWRERLALHGDSATVIGHGDGFDLTARRKQGWYVEQLGTTWVQRVTPRVIILPTSSAESPTSVQRLRPQQALTRIMPSSPWVTLEADYADEHLDLLTRLVTQCRTYEAIVGRDLFERPEILPELCA